MKTKIIALIILLFIGSSIYSQSNDLSETELSKIEAKIGKMIGSLQNKFSILGKKGMKTEIKKTYIDMTLNMFIEKGKPYIDPDGNDRLGVTMEVSNKKGRIKKYLLTEYLNNLIKLQYAKVEITQTDVYQLSELYQVGNHYEATATISQKFVGYCQREGVLKPCYEDVTKKTIKIYVIKNKDTFGEENLVRFGDISIEQDETLE